MKLLKLIESKIGDSRWKSGKVFICYSTDRILRMRARGEDIADGELFDIKDIDDDTLMTEVKPNQWWIEDGDLCVDFYRTW